MFYVCMLSKTVMLWFCSSFMCQTNFGRDYIKHVAWVKCVKDPIFIVDRICKGSCLFIIVDDSSALSCFYC